MRRFIVSILEILMKDPHATSEELAEAVGKSLRTVKRTLASLKAKGLIDRVGSTKTGYWKTNYVLVLWFWF